MERSEAFVFIDPQEKRLLLLLVSAQTKCYILIWIAEITDIGKQFSNDTDNICLDVNRLNNIPFKDSRGIFKCVFLYFSIK